MPKTSRAPRLTFSPDVLKLNPGLALALPFVENEYKSNMERDTAQIWIPARSPLWWGYEMVTFKLPGGAYTPDFILVESDSTITFIESKGWSPSIRASRKAFLEAAHTMPFFRWCWLTKGKRGEWKEGWVK